MTGSITGATEQGVTQSFRPAVMVGVGSPMDVVLANSGTLLRDFSNDYLYMNNSAGAGAGSSWILFTSGA
jgi:hypothetical protein